MIEKLEDKKNGYRLTSTSMCDELREIRKSYDKRISCIIVNKRMARFLKSSIMGASIIQVNNTIPDNVLYFNSVN